MVCDTCTAAALGVFGGTGDIERDEAQQLVDAHFSQRSLDFGVENLIGNALFIVEHAVNPLFHSAAADEFVDEDIFRLADAKRAVGGLILDGRIPPTVEMDDVCGGSQVQAAAARLQGDDEKRRAGVVLKHAHKFRTATHGRAAMKDEAWPTEHVRQEASQRLCECLKLRKDQSLFLPFDDRLAKHSEALELAAFVLPESLPARNCEG